MKNLKSYGKYLKPNILFGILAAGFLSCNDDGIPENLEFEQFRYIYLSAAREGVKTVTVTPESDITFVFGGIRYGGTTNMQQGEIQAEIAADLSLVAAYNTANNTEYLPLPTAHFALDKTTLSIENGKNFSDVANLTVKNGGNLDNTKQYLLPVTVKTINAPENLPLNEEFKTAYWVVLSNILPVDAEFNKGAWEVVASSVWQAGYEAEDMFDNDINTYWHTDLTGLPQDFTIDMAGNKRITGFYLTHRQEPNETANPKNIRIETSMDEQVWETVYQTGNLDQSKTRISLPLGKTVIARYVRLTIIGVSDASATYSYIAEFDAYNNTEN
ncbi:MAG: discoidin domain-containing protein [Bacteroidales bacterium]|jgi:hypothetical protein|nr:discoidin domain-containing protein [Bacteroidales bacterium]